MSAFDKACAAAWPFLWDTNDTNTPAHNEARARMRAAFLAVCEPDDDFMRQMYPDPTYDGRLMTKQGERSRRAGRMQITRFIDTLLASADGGA